MSSQQINQSRGLNNGVLSYWYPILTDWCDPTLIKSTVSISPLNWGFEYFHTNKKEGAKIIDVLCSM